MADSAPSTLGEIIRRQRELSELSLRQFASMAGISNPYLSQIERGLRLPSDQVAESIARALRTSADALYAEAGLEVDGEASGTIEAIRSDPALTARQRQALVTAYQAFVAVNGGGAGRRRRGQSRSGGRPAQGGGEPPA